MTDTYPILILTLEGDEARRAPLIRSLEALGLDYHILHGVDGRKGLPPALESMVDRAEAEFRNRRLLSDGELACSLSHRAAYQYILDRDLAGGIVLEDDAILCDGFKTFVEAKMYLRAPMILLDYSRISVKRRKMWKLDGVGALRPVVKSSTLATGYVLSREAARKMLTVTTPVRDVADWPCNLAKFSAAVVHPRLVDHPPPGAISHLTVDRLPLEAVRMSKRRGRQFRLSYWIERWQTLNSVRIGAEVKNHTQGERK